MMVKCCEEKGCIANVGGQCEVAGCRGAIISVEGHPHANTADAAQHYDLACYLLDGFRREEEAHHA